MNQEQLNQLKKASEAIKSSGTTVKEVEEILYNVWEMMRQDTFMLNLHSILRKETIKQNSHLISSLDPNHYDTFIELLICGWDVEKAYLNVSWIFNKTVKAPFRASDIVKVINQFQEP